jgi:predicted phosphate transport protein (TIGR00153 family)
MMVRSILGLFAESPFGPLRELAHKVAECAQEVPALFDAFYAGDYDAVRQKAEEISRLEHEADLLKDRVRDKLPKTIFLPVDRRDLLEVIASLDAIADCAEDVGILFTLREMEPHEDLIEPLKVLLPQVMKVVDQTLAIMDHLDVLVEVGFKGPEAKRIQDMIEELGRLEHEADLTQDELARTLFSKIGDDIKPGSLFLWNKILNKVGDVANTAEKAGTRVRLFIAK